MKQRPFGTTGVRVSEVGLGTWQIGGTEWGDVTDEQALAVLQAAADAGITLLDTADIYGGGRSESLIGRFLKTPAGRNMVVVTKLGRRGDPGWPENFTLATARRHTQDSLRRLGVEQIFLTQWHCIPAEQMRAGEVFEHLRTLQKEGLIRHWGVSVETVEEGLLCLKQPGCASLQVIFNIFRQKLVDELLPAARAAGVAILARVPLASGLLSGRFKSGHAFAERDHRRFNADGQAFNVGETFAGLPFETGVVLAEKVRAVLGPEDRATLAQKALRWVLDHDAVTGVIPGATRPDQVAGNAAASDLAPLSADTHRRLRELYETEIRALIRGPY
jgi:aryl-alcohol dehydrogenase-like predicted oxidoreductase